MQSIYQLQLHYHAYLQVQFTYCMVSAMKHIMVCFMDYLLESRVIALPSVKYSGRVETDVLNHEPCMVDNTAGEATKKRPVFDWNLHPQTGSMS